MMQIPEWKKLRPRMLELMIRIQAGGPLIESDKETITEMNNTILIVNELADVDGLMQEYLRKITP